MAGHLTAFLKSASPLIEVKDDPPSIGMTYGLPNDPLIFAFDYRITTTKTPHKQCGHKSHTSSY